jgi:hypothetical protein
VSSVGENVTDLHCGIRSLLSETAVVIAYVRDGILERPDANTREPIVMIEAAPSATSVQNSVDGLVIV